MTLLWDNIKPQGFLSNSRGERTPKQDMNQTWGVRMALSWVVKSKLCGSRSLRSSSNWLCPKKGRTFSVPSVDRKGPSVLSVTFPSSSRFHLQTIPHLHKPLEVPPASSTQHFRTPYTKPRLQSTLRAGTAENGINTTEPRPECELTFSHSSDNNPAGGKTTGVQVVG